MDRSAATRPGASRRKPHGAVCSGSRGGGTATSAAVRAASIRTISGATDISCNERVMRPLCAIALLAGFLACVSAAGAQEFALVEVPSVAALAPGDVKPKTIAFTDHRNDELADPATGLMRFEDWNRARPLQKQILSLYPGYVEPRFNATVNGVTKSHHEKLHMYVAEARFLIGKPPGSLDLSRYARLDFLAGIDPAIKHRPLAPDELA